MLELKEGAVLFYRIFDVGWEIDIHRLSRYVEGERFKVHKIGPRKLYFKHPPFTVFLGKRYLIYNGKKLNFDIFARFYNFGAITILFKFHLKNLYFDEVKDIFWFLWDNGDVIHIAKNFLKEIFEKYISFISKPKIYDDFEDMYVLFVKGFKPKVKAEDITQRIDFADLLLGEKYELSDFIKNEFKKNFFSYSSEDLVVLNWDTAFVYDTEGLMDVPTIIEFCNVILLEMRYFDAYLDNFLHKTYDEIENLRGGLKTLIKYKHFREVIRNLLVLYNDIAEAVDKVINGLKTFEDNYYNKIYKRMLSILGMSEWEKSVLNKQKVILEIYSLLNNEITNARFMVIEVLIVLLILFEFITYLIKG